MAVSPLPRLRPKLDFALSSGVNARVSFGTAYILREFSGFIIAICLYMWLSVSFHSHVSAV